MNQLYIIYSFFLSGYDEEQALRKYGQRYIKTSKNVTLLYTLRKFHAKEAEHLRQNYAKLLLDTYYSFETKNSTGVHFIRFVFLPQIYLQNLCKQFPEIFLRNKPMAS